MTPVQRSIVPQTSVSGMQLRLDSQQVVPLRQRAGAQKLTPASTPAPHVLPVGKQLRASSQQV